MCVIIIKQKENIISEKIAATSARINPHGLGIVWLDTFEITYHTSQEYRQLLTQRPFIAHFRYATAGKINRENVHPFQCGAQKSEYLMMNGTIAGLGTADECDTKVLARQLGNNAPRSQWKSILAKHPHRFVSVNVKTRTFQIYNRDLFTYHDGILYSKANVLNESLIAVYGTLKYGFSNYRNYLTESEYIGAGETKDKYPLVINGLPYLVNEKGKGHNVDVDVFRVDADTLDDIDRLEGHPHWYVRKQIPIKLECGNVVNCWTYFNPVMTLGQTLHKSYTQYVPESLQRDTHINEEPYCLDCYNDLEPDGYGHYHCQHCYAWFTENEIKQTYFTND